jgi:dihydroorotate dehydrogenase subfamily 1
VTGSAFSLVGGAAPDPETLPDAAVVPVAQASADDDPVTDVFETAVQPVDPEPEIADAAGLVKAAQLAEQEVARAAEQAGAESLVVANTILAMAIDVETFRPKLGNIMGGLSGPAVKPIMVRMTYQCAKAVGIPVIGCGGIATAEDAIEYMLAGASAVQVGTATFLRPRAMLDVLDGLTGYCERKGLARVDTLIGAVVDTGMVVDELEAVP